MAQLVKDVMTSSPTVLGPGDTVIAAAQAMKQSNIGDVIVADSDGCSGIVTDRDLAIRVLAEGLDPQSTHLSDVCSGSVISVTPEMAVDEAVQTMRDNAIRRLPVCQGSDPVGVLSLGDLAMERDPSSALSDISSAPPNG